MGQLTLQAPPIQQQDNQSRSQICKEEDVAEADWIHCSCRSKQGGGASFLEPLQDTGIAAAQHHVTQESQRRQSGWNQSLDSNTRIIVVSDPSGSPRTQPADQGVGMDPQRLSGALCAGYTSSAIWEPSPIARAPALSSEKTCKHRYEDGKIAWPGSPAHPHG